MNKYISQEEMIKRKTVNENFTWREKLILKWLNKTKHYTQYGC